MRSENAAVREAANETFRPRNGTVPPSERPPALGDWKALTLADCMVRRPPIPFIVEGLLPQSTVTLIHSRGGCHKTNLCIDLGTCILTGEPWLAAFAVEDKGTTFTVPQPRPVIWVSQDTPGSEMLDRIAACARAHGASTSAPFQLYSFPSPALDLSSEAHVVGLEEIVRNAGAGAIFLDNLSVIAGASEENSTTEMRPVMMGLRRVAERTGAALVVIHHESKAGGSRGSSSIRDLVDISLEIRRDEQSREILIVPDKCRFAPVPKFGARFYFEHWPDGAGSQLMEFRFSCAPAGKTTAAVDELDDRVRQAASKVGLILEQRPGLGRNEIISEANKLGCSKDATIRAVSFLVGTGIVLVRDGPNRSHLHFLAPEDAFDEQK